MQTAAREPGGAALHQRPAQLGQLLARGPPLAGELTDVGHHRGDRLCTRGDQLRVGDGLWVPARLQLHGRAQVLAVADDVVATLLERVDDPVAPRTELIHACRGRPEALAVPRDELA